MVISIYLSHISSHELSLKLRGNVNDECFPQEKTRVEKMGLKDYGIAAAAFFAAFVIACCIAFYACYTYDKRKSCNPQTPEETKPVEEDTTDDR